MGNRSSSHYPPPPSAWPHGPYGAYTAPTATPGAFDAKRGLSGGPPGAYAEPYVPHPQMRRSMISLNADSGYMTSPSDSERMRMRGSRMSLNHLDFERQLLYPPDPKTMRKLEKMEKKQQKLLKKMGRSVPTAVFLPPQPMPSVYARAMSFDDLNRYFFVIFSFYPLFLLYWILSADFPAV
ncbi:hypothetical protein NECAME_05604 [Necator americanus]|uniref:Uncharacterized protein n=1 Tax=Necator americanus TaxID=51031 RepID=W2SHR8_NECAM|nr:hypothetical protein NECAME_05604 [Necator americanus]ETN68416.1 hypothetical protein NECAME_05604 [Necator americanus]